MWTCFGVAAVLLGAQAQVPAVAVRDLVVDQAAELVGRAAILRGGYAGGQLTFDAQGRIESAPKTLPWTLAGMNVETVTRKGATTLELDGVRVAIRYNPDGHVFERHPLKDERVKILLELNEGGRGLDVALAAMFSVGIDPALQRTMPTYWRHYFAPGTAWAKDALTGQTVVPVNAPVAGMELPVAEKRPEPEFTAEARQDKVKGTVQLRVTVGTDGVPRRIVIRQPLGYGLDDRTVEAVEKWRFQPGTKDGVPVAMEVVVNQGFEYGVGR
jgi:TonB family protein